MVSKTARASDMMHYLDDYVTWGRPSSQECNSNKTYLTKTCDQLGVSVAHEKCKGPATTITYVGIEIDFLTI